ncbi:MAG: TonB-dependent receptor [Rhodothermia bacterium]|nr:TonB-dependent receptor [Rhodothermia bacterium]
MIALKTVSAFLLALFVALVAEPLTPFGNANAQPAHLTSADSLLYYEMPIVVVTATRGARSLRDVPISTEVLMAEEIEARGNVRLTDLLAEQAGIAIVHEFGAGVQMQGLSSDYVLILVDGEPVIGRSGGTLDLDRLTIRGLERIEIVRGPSSSLYGSDALAGVINLITRDPSTPFEAALSAQFETHSTADLSLTGEFSQGPVSGSILLDRYSSDGYDLFEDRIGQTAPGFVDYTASGRIKVDASDRTKVRAAGRFGRLDQKDEIGLSFGAGSAPTASIGERTEWNVSSGVEHAIGDRVRLDGSVYLSRFISTTALVEEDSRFAQLYGETEIKADVVLGTSHLMTAGVGGARESVEADRVVGGSQTAEAGFAYLQHQWTPSIKLNLIASARLDHHTDYTDRVSPKFSVLYKPVRRLHLRGSVGSGFKAPTFQQRYLDFRNPIGGYSVFGASGVASTLAQLEDEGGIRRYTGTIDVGTALRPEHSWSFNVGADAYVSDQVEVRLNLFHNRIEDLIETVLIAEQTNGQQIFSYSNLDRIRTQGVEVNLGLNPVRSVRVDVGYQFLDTADLDVLDAIRDGSVFKRVDGRDVRVTVGEYGGLFQRSRHSASLNVRYRVKRLGLTASVRGTYKGRYGLFDRNGNLILDDDAEYVSGHMLWNVTATKDITSRVKIRAGARNLFDHTDPELIPALSGRLIFAGIELRTN